MCCGKTLHNFPCCKRFTALCTQGLPGNDGRPGADGKTGLQGTPGIRGYPGTSSKINLTEDLIACLELLITTAV